ncbi:MAG TPA: phosphatase PAP2 family protein [Vibrio sp.]|nr:phosphatase PAP2 family protein [Vibrio sp.]
MRSIESIAKLDLAFSLFCLQNRFCYPISRLSKAVSHTGDGHLYVAIGLMAFFFGGENGKLFLLVGLLSFSIELPIYWLAKNVFKRRRPPELSTLIPSFITPSDRYSLPSGHTAAAFLMAGVIGHFYPDSQVFAMCWASLIALSRILLGVHFLTDVLLGACLGMACVRWSLQWVGG